MVSVGQPGPSMTLVLKWPVCFGMEGPEPCVISVISESSAAQEFIPLADFKDSVKEGVFTRDGICKTS